MVSMDQEQRQGCAYCREQSDYWGSGEWRFVKRIGAVSRYLEMGRCPKCGTYYVFGDELMGRPGFVAPDRVEQHLEEMRAYESSCRDH